MRRTLLLCLVAVTGATSVPSLSASAERNPSVPAGAVVVDAGPASDAQELLPLYAMLAEAVAQVEANHAVPVDRRALFESAIRGMLKDLDPYSTYLGPEEFQRYQQRVRGEAKPTVAGRHVLPSGGWQYRIREKPRVAYIAIGLFTARTPNELREAVARVRADGAEAAVLDLRFNAGGLLSAAVDCADLFLSEGVIVATEGRATRRREWRASAGETFDNVPLAVLVNRYSASGAEVLAAALQDHNRAVIVGERSWGKGSVQNLFELEDGKSGIKLTTAFYTRPSGANIHRLPGVGPDEVWGVAPQPSWALVVTADEAKTLADDHAKRFGGVDPKANGGESNGDSGAPVIDRQLDLAVNALLELLSAPEAPEKSTTSTQ